jgi:murein DD-endopeptidase MepM/ murein hydrolase activator NlpD
VDLYDVGSIALQQGLSQQGAMAAMAIAQTEGGLNGAVGDHGQSFGPFQFYTGGQLQGFAKALGVSAAEAGHIAVTQPETAVAWALRPGGYLGDSIRTAEKQGLSGPEIATYAQRHGQVSVSPERAGQNYNVLFSGDNAITPTVSTRPVANSRVGEPSGLGGQLGGATSSFDPNTPIGRTAVGQSLSATQSAASAGSSASGGGYVFPVADFTGQVQDHWGSVKGGSDLMAPRGTPIQVMESGKVTLSGWDNVGGNSLEVQGDDGNEYYYAHFDKPSGLKAGQRVNAGDYVAPVGNTGDASGGPTHLHIGIGPKIMLGADKYGGTGGDFDAESLLQQAQQGGGASAADQVWQTSPTPVGRSAVGSSLSLQPQSSPGPTKPVGHTAVGTSFDPSSTTNSSWGSTDLNGAYDAGPGAWGSLTDDLVYRGQQNQPVSDFATPIPNAAAGSPDVSSLATPIGNTPVGQPFGSQQQPTDSWQALTAPLTTPIFKPTPLFGGTQ